MRPFPKTRLDRQIAVGAERFNMRLLSFAALETLGRVGDGNETLTAEVTRTLAGARLPQRREPRPALNCVVRAIFIGCRAMRRGIKWRDRKIAAAVARDTRDLLDAIHLEVLGPIPIRQHAASMKLDAPAGLGKEVHYGGAIQAKLRRIQRVFQDRLHAIEQQRDLELAARTGAQRARQPRSVR